jgi:hypothetical protein
VPAAAAAFLGLALSVYGVFAQPPDPDRGRPRVWQEQRGVRVEGDSRIVGQAGVLGGRDGGPEADITQIVTDTTVKGSQTIIGRTDAGPAAEAGPREQL